MATDIAVSGLLLMQHLHSCLKPSTKLLAEKRLNYVVLSTRIKRKKGREGVDLELAAPIPAT